jgi:hypothetical protein
MPPYLGGKEALEQPMELILGYSGTIVLNHSADRVGVCEGGADEEAAFSSTCHRLQRVDREICKDLVELDSVAPHNGEIQSQIVLGATERLLQPLFVGDVGPRLDNLVRGR